MEGGGGEFGPVEIFEFAPERVGAVPNGGIFSGGVGGGEADSLDADLVLGQERGFSGDLFFDEIPQ